MKEIYVIVRTINGDIYYAPEPHEGQFFELEVTSPYNLLQLYNIYNDYPVNIMFNKIVEVAEVNEINVSEINKVFKKGAYAETTKE